MPAEGPRPLAHERRDATPEEVLEIIGVAQLIGRLPRALGSDAHPRRGTRQHASAAAVLLNATKENGHL